MNINKKLADMNGAPVETHFGNTVAEMIPSLFSKVEPYIKRALAGEAVPDVEAAFPTNGQTFLVSYQPYDAKRAGRNRFRMYKALSVA